MGLLVVVQAVLGIAVVAGVFSKPFRPTPALAPVRGVVNGMALVSSGMLVVGLTQVWWVVEDWEREDTLTTRGDDPLVLIVVGAGLVANLVTVLAAWGRRNWAPLALLLTWALLGLAWFESTGEPTDSDASGDARLGLHLATWALLLTTVSAIAGSVNRLFERRPSDPRPVDATSPQDRRGTLRRDRPS